MDVVRVALLGYGLAGRVFHASLLRATDGFELAAVVTSDAERAAQATADQPGVRVLASADEVWAGAYDLVVIATANAAHVPQAVAALEAGMPVVVDKPLCRTAAEAERLAALASERGLLLTVFQNRRWDGDFLALRDAVGSGELGTVHRFESRIERWRPAPKGYWRESGDPAALGGLLYDLGSHLVDQALQLLGPVAEVEAEVRRLRPWAQVDDDVFLALRHENGAVSHLWASSVVAQPGPRFRVLGSRGAWVTDEGDAQEDALRAGRSPYDVPEHHARLSLDPEGSGSPAVSERVDSRGDWPAFYRGVHASLTEGAPAPVRMDEVVAALRVLETAAAS